MADCYAKLCFINQLLDKVYKTVSSKTPKTTLPEIEIRLPPIILSLKFTTKILERTLENRHHTYI